MMSDGVAMLNGRGCEGGDVGRSSFWGAVFRLSNETFDLAHSGFFPAASALRRAERGMLENHVMLAR